MIERSKVFEPSSNPSWGLAVALLLVLAGLVI